MSYRSRLYIMHERYIRTGVRRSYSRVLFLWPEYFHVIAAVRGQSGDLVSPHNQHGSNAELMPKSHNIQDVCIWTLYDGAPTILHVMIQGLLLHWTLFIYLCNQGLPQPEGDIANDELRWFSINFFQIWLVIQAGIRDWQLQSSNQSSI